LEFLSFAIAPRKVSFCKGTIVCRCGEYKYSTDGVKLPNLKIGLFEFWFWTILRKKGLFFKTNTLLE
jgi:hypothetical protein